MILDQNTKDRLRLQFFASSLEEILSREKWRKRLGRPHSTVPNLCAWEGPKDRLALLMNLFCFPDVRESNDFKALLDCRNLWPKFLVPAPLEKLDGSLDPTSVDLVIDDLFFQASLAEKDFTEQRVEVVERYLHFDEVFQSPSLRRHNGNYMNFRVIRNLLAAFQYEKRHVLLCDCRRTDLVDAYLATVESLKHETFRSRCRVAFWQDLLKDVDPGLSTFIRTRFGLLD